MANGISVAIGADTREYARGVKSGMIDPVTNAAKELEALGTSGTDAGRTLEQSFTQQQRATQQLQGDIDQLNVKIKEGTRTSSSAMSQSFGKATHDTEEGLKELKDSAKQNSIQTAASFNGSFDSISGGVQGLVSEFMAGFGPGGLIAGIVLAGGLGALTSAIDNAGAATQADKQAAADLAQQYIDTGTKGKRAFTDVKSAIEDMATNTDGTAIITLQDAYDEATRAGANYADVVKSIASADPEQIDSALARVRALAQQDQMFSKLGTTQADFNSKSQLGNLANQAAVTNLTKALEKAKTQATLAGRAQELAAQAGISKMQQKIDLIDQLHTGYTDSAGAASDYLNKESGLFDVSKYLTAMHKRQQALEDYQNTLNESQLSASAKSYIESLGEDDAASFMAGYKNASASQKQQLDNIWSAAGRSNAQSYGAAIGEDLKGLKIDAPHLPAPSTDAYKRAVREAHAEAQAYLKAHPLQSGAVAYTVNGKPIY